MEYIVDTDMGFDDFIAIYMLIKNGIKIKGITTSFGNTTVENVTENVLSFLDMVGLDIPVYMGTPSPLGGDFVADPSFSGDKGMFGATFPKVNKKFFGQVSAKEEAVDFLISACNKDTGIISLAPATNIARALKRKPDIEVGEVITSSGYFGINDVKERRMAWNMRMDPQASKILYKSGLKIKAVGLDASGNFVDENFIDFKKNYNRTSLIGKMMDEAEKFIRGRSYRYFTLVSDALAVMPIINKESTEFIQGEIKFTNSMDDKFCILEERLGGRVEVAKEVDLDLFIWELLRLM